MPTSANPVPLPIFVVVATTLIGVAAALFVPDHLVEIEAIAVID